MNCLILSLFSLSFFLQLRLMPCREFVIVSPLSVSFSLSFCNTHTHTHPRELLWHTLSRNQTCSRRHSEKNKKTQQTHHKVMQNSILIRRHTWFIIISTSHPFCSGKSQLSPWECWDIGPHGVTAGNEISQQELIDVCNAWPCFHLRLKAAERREAIWRAEVQKKQKRHCC